MHARPPSLLVMALLALVLLGPVAVPAWAVEPDEILTDAGLEARARSISAGLRCLVCQNQSIDDSNAPLAKDLRLLVRERLKEGDSDDQVISFIVARYGEFVLLRPRFEPQTLVLWLGPLLVLVIAGWAILKGMRRSHAMATAHAGPAPLSEDEKKKLDELLGPGDEA